MYTLFDGVRKIGSAKTKGGISDGDHTFDELYDHRCTLFLMVMKSNPTDSWFSEKHDDGSTFDGWFICGLDLPQGTITYHLPVKMLKLAEDTGAERLAKGKHWDGHTPEDVLTRMKLNIKR